MNIPIVITIDANSSVTSAAKAAHYANASATAGAVVTVSAKAHRALSSNVVSQGTVTSSAKAHHAVHSSPVGQAVVTASPIHYEYITLDLGGGATFVPGTPTLSEALTTNLAAGSTFSIVMTLTSRIANTPQNVPIPIVRTVPQPPPIVNLQIAKSGQVKNPPLQTGVKVKVG